VRLFAFRLLSSSCGSRCAGAVQAWLGWHGFWDPRGAKRSRSRISCSNSIRDMGFLARRWESAARQPRAHPSAHGVDPAQLISLRVFAYTTAQTSRAARGKTSRCRMHRRARNAIMLAARMAGRDSTGAWEREGRERRSRGSRSPSMPRRHMKNVR